LKWPNDVLVARKKIAGILTEKAPDGALVVGIGVNINDVALPDGSLSMADAMVDPPEPRHLATQIVDKLCRWVSRSENQFSQVVRTWKAYMYQDLPLEIALADRTVTGRQIDLTYDGSVVVADENNNEHVISCGDAQVVSSV
jgi:BirA family biotin operon repressor/biotin-[acetyl-CoA-carboxylase] ligase